jgi:hypothetical protein
MTCQLSNPSLGSSLMKCDFQLDWLGRFALYASWKLYPLAEMPHASRARGGGGAPAQPSTAIWCERTHHYPVDRSLGERNGRRLRPMSRLCELHSPHKRHWGCRSRKRLAPRLSVVSSSDYRITHPRTGFGSAEISDANSLVV